MTIFRKKAKIASYKVFCRYKDTKLFGVNVIINEKELFLAHNSWLADFRCKNDICFACHEYNAKNFPRIFKEAIIDTCIELNENILAKTSIPFLASPVVFIPQAFSLEELAIKMELEK